MNNSTIDRIELGIGLTLLAVIVILVFMASICRFFGYPIIWSVDFAQLLFIWLCFLGANRALRTKSHLGVDFFIRSFSRRTRFIIEAVLTSFIIVFLLSLAVSGVQLTLLNKERLFGDSGIPYAFVTIAVPCGSLLLCVTLISNFITACRENGRNGTLILTRSDLTTRDSEL